MCVDNNCIWDEWVFNANISSFVNTKNVDDTIMLSTGAEFNRWNITAENFTDIIISEDGEDGEAVILTNPMKGSIPENWFDWPRVKHDVLGSFIGSRYWNWDGDFWNFLEEDGESIPTDNGNQGDVEIDCGVPCMPAV
jgi:hypothetical protein